MLRYLLWAAQAVLVVGFILAWAARYVHPRDFWWPQLFAVGMPVWVLLLVGAAAAHGWARQPAGVALYAVLLLAVAPRYLALPDRPGDRPTLGVLSFNADDAHFRSGDRRSLAEVLDEHTPDLVALQEAPVMWARAESGRPVAESVGLPALFRHRDLEGALPELDGPLARVNLPVFTSLETRSFEEPEGWGAEDGDGERRSTLSRAVVEWEGRPVAVYNVHLRSFGPVRPWRQNQRNRALSPRKWRAAFATYRQDFIARAEDAERLRALLEAEPHPFLLCGDLNSTPHHWTYAHLARGLHDAFQRAGRGWGATYHDQLPLVRIDYVLASRDWGVRRASVLRGVASDHHPVFAEVFLREGSSRAPRSGSPSPQEEAPSDRSP